MDDNWTTDAPDRDRPYWIIKRLSDGSFSNPVQQRAVSEVYGSNNVNYWYGIGGDFRLCDWKEMVLNWHFRSVLPVTPPPLPQSAAGETRT